jgi:hypothetical protein
MDSYSFPNSIAQWIFKNYSHDAADLEVAPRGFGKN